VEINILARKACTARFTLVLLSSIMVIFPSREGRLSLQNFENAYALVNPHSHFLEIYRNKVLIAAVDRNSCLAWEYVATPQQPTSRAGQILLQTHEV